MKLYTVFFRENNQDLKSHVYAADKHDAMLQVFKAYPCVQIRKAQLKH